MIEHVDFHDLPGSDQIARDLDVIRRWSRIILAVFERQVYGHAPVTRIGPAASAIAEELSVIGLTEGLHLAWQDAAEGVWRTERPLPEPTPFQVHTEAFLAWRKACKAETPESRQRKILKTAVEFNSLLRSIIAPGNPKQDAPAQ
jgi:hypothetical protein